MSDARGLSPDDARRLRRRWAVAVAVSAAAFVAGVVALVELGGRGDLVWLAACVPGVLVWFFVSDWAARCPRCGGSVFGRGEADDPGAHPADSGWFFALPHRCRACGVWLKAARAGRSETTEPPDTAESSGGSGGPALPV